MDGWIFFLDPPWWYFQKVTVYTYKVYDICTQGTPSYPIPLLFSECRVVFLKAGVFLAHDDIALIVIIIGLAWYLHICTCIKIYDDEVANGSSGMMGVDIKFMITWIPALLKPKLYMEK